MDCLLVHVSQFVSPPECERNPDMKVNMNEIFGAERDLHPDHRSCILLPSLSEGLSIPNGTMSQISCEILHCFFVHADKTSSMLLRSFIVPLIILFKVPALFPTLSSSSSLFYFYHHQYHQ